MRFPVAMVLILSTPTVCWAEDPLEALVKASGIKTEKVDRDWAVQRILTHLRAKDWKAAEAGLKMLAATPRPKSAYKIPLDHFYDRAQALPHALVTTWASEAPNSSFAQASLGEALIRHAWEARGSGWASSVTEAGRKAFLERLAKARTALNKAASLDPRGARQRASLITVSRARSEPEARTRELLSEVSSIDPAYFYAHWQQMIFLLPKWHGSREAMWRPARSLQKSAPTHPATFQLVLLTHEEASKLAGPSGVKPYFNQPKVKAELEQLLKRWFKAIPDAPQPYLAKVKLLRVWGTLNQREINVWSKKAAERGDPTAMAVLGRLWKNSTEADRVQQALTYLASASLSQAPAAYDLGICFSNGYGVTVNQELAFRWFKVSALGGYRKALESVAERLRRGIGTRKDVPLALQLHDRAAKQGALKSAWILANVHMRGTGVPVDVAKALPYLRFAVARKHAPCMFLLAQLLWAGDGVKQDRTEALRLARTASKMGYRPADKLLAIMERARSQR